MDHADFLSKTPLFEGCSPDTVKSIAEQTRIRKFNAGDEIIKEGSQSTMGFYILLEGTAQATRSGQHLSDYASGDYFGEIALLLDDTPRTATVSATSDVSVLALTRWDFKAILKLNPEVAIDVMGVLAQRLAATDSVFGG